MKNSVGSNWVTILGHPVPKFKFYSFLAALALICMIAGIGGYLFYQHLKLAAEVRAEAQPTLSDVRARYEDRMDPGSRALVDPLGALLQYHIEATNFKRMTSLVVSGQYFSEGTVLDLTIMAREPSRFLQMLQYRNMRLVVGLVEGELWYNQTSPLLAEDDDNLTRVNRVLMAMECAIPILAWQFEDKGFRTNFRRLPDGNREGREVAVLENRAFSDMVILHQIDLETGLELARSSLVRVGEVDQLVELTFAAPAEGLGFAFPSGYTVHIDQKHVCTAEFQKYEFNKGIASYLFQKR